MDQLSSNSGQINHVSDTALMVAACRALETELPDADKPNTIAGLHKLRKNSPNQWL